MGGAAYCNLGTARPGYRAFSELAGLANGFVLDPIDDVVLVKDASTPANKFAGSMAQALAAGILVYSSPSTKYVRNSAGIWTSGTALRCHYSTAGAAQGLLSEPQRTNLLLNSAALATQSVTVSATAYTLSFEGTGTVTLSGASTAGPLVGTGATNRVSLTFTPSAGSLTLTVSGTVNYANLEAGIFRTSPIVTAGSQVTRNGDNLYVDLTKVPWSDTANTIIVHAQPSPDSTTNAHALFTVHDTTANERTIALNSGAGVAGIVSQWRHSNVVQAQISGSSVATAAFKVALAGQANDFEFVANGASKGTDTSGSMPSGLTRLQLGRLYSDSLHWAAPIGFVATVPQRLSQADMIARTS